MTALVKLLELNDSRLDSLTVPGELMVENAATIMTRSKSKKKAENWTIVPFKAKILSILLQEFQTVEEEEALKNGDEDDDEVIHLSSCCKCAMDV